MEFLKVVVPGKESQDIAVLVNRARKGKAGEVLTLNSGYVLVSIDLPNAEEAVIDLCDTTPTQPHVLKVRA